MKRNQHNNRQVRRTLAGLLFGALVLLVSGCLPPGLTDAENAATDGVGDRGTLSITIGDSMARTLLPDISMEAASYTVTGRGPDNANFIRTTSAGTVEVPGLAPGGWTVTVEALNDTGLVIGKGSATVTVAAGSTQPVSIVISCLDGHGTLALTVNWDTADVADPSVVAQLVPDSGATEDLVFDVGSGTATSTTSSLATGYHTLSLQLFDGGTAVMGAIDIARIVKDQTTTGIFDFYDINPATGGLDVTIDPELDDPLDVTLSGLQTEIALGVSMQLGATVAAYTGDVTFTWYLNGVLQSSGDAFSTPADLPAGVYRVDVSAVSSDGQRAGTATGSFTVVEGVDASVTLGWDANTEPDLAGYNVYWGLVSGTYDNSVDVGNTTTYTLSGLEPGRTYYFAVTAYDTGGNESEFSNEVSFVAQ